MKINARFVVILILSGMVSGSTEALGVPPTKQPSSDADPFGAGPTRPTPASQEKQYRGFMPGTKITLQRRKDKYFLGENILLDYKITYDGEGALAIDMISGLRQPDCYVIATDLAGNRVSDCTMKFDITGQSGGYVRRGHAATLTIPLMLYCRFEKPGVYRVRAAFDLYWSKKDHPGWSLPAIPKDDPRWAETSITLALPDATQARQVVEQMCRNRLCAHDSHDNQPYRNWWVIPEYADFTCLQYPVYLPILGELASGKRGDKRALVGITHIPTPEAAVTLLRLLKDADKVGRTRRAGQFLGKVKVCCFD
jgi:hypothetical protein